MAYVYWITGLSGAGKTSIGTLLYERIKRKYPNTVFLDGDALREVFGNDLGYTREERIQCAMRYARLCKMLQEQGQNVICCTISMFDDVRSWNREHIANYREIYVRVSMEELVKRNQKGLYGSFTGEQTSRNQKGSHGISVEGLIKNDELTRCGQRSREQVAGIQVEIEEPKNPDIILGNEGDTSISELVDKVIEKFRI